MGRRWAQEEGKGKGKEDGKEANVGEGENDTAPTDAKGKKMVRRPIT